MRRMTLVAIASLFAAGLASAQMKVQQQKPTAPGSPAVMSPTQKAEPPLESARRITRDEAYKMVKAKKAVFIDVRSRDTWAEGHLPGALSIPLSELNNRLRELPPGKFLITYCA